MPQPQSDGVHRLTNMVVEEVSLVDRAANKRKFLVVKRDDSAGDKTMLKPDGRGGFTRVSKADDEEEKKAKPPAPPFPPKKPDEEDDKKTKADDEGEGGAKPDDEEDKDKAATKKAGDDAAEALEEIAQELLAMAEDLEGEDDVDDDMQKRMVAAHKKLGGALEKHAPKAQKAEVAKVGRKMAKQRLETFKKALDMLDGILKELDEVAEAMDEAESKKRLAKAQTAPRGGAASNSIPVETPTRTKKSDDEVSWPMDLNRPISRENVAKDCSFFDD